MQQNRLGREEQADHAADNPALSHVVERNIRTIIRLRLQAVRAQSVQDCLAVVLFPPFAKGGQGGFAWQGRREIPPSPLRKGEQRDN